MLRKIILTLTASAAVFVGIAATGPQIAAQTLPSATQKLSCAGRDDIVKVLRSQYQEDQIGFGQANATTILELFVGPAGSWTMIATMATGYSCIIGIGTEWQRIDNAPPRMSESG